MRWTRNREAVTLPFIMRFVGRMLTCLSLTIAITGRPTSADTIEVKPSENLIEVNTRGAPLSSVLERVASAMGFELRFEGSPPRQLVQARLRRSSTAGVIVDLMQGQNLSYAMQLDKTGKKLVKLIVITDVGRVSSPPGRRAMRAAPMPGWETPREDREDLDSDVPMPPEMEESMPSAEELPEKEPASNALPARAGSPSTNVKSPFTVVPLPAAPTPPQEPSSEDRPPTEDRPPPEE